MNRKILFLGYAVASDEAEKLTGASVAGNKMQINLLKELVKKADVSVITIYPVASFGKDERLFYRRQRRKLFNRQEYIRVGFVNLPVIKQICQILMTYRETRKFIKQNPDGIIFSYNMYPQTGIPLSLIHFLYKKKNFVLLADLPIDERIKRSFISRGAKALYDRITKFCIKHINYAIVLNKNVLEKYQLNIPYIVMEGAVDITKNNVGISPRKNTEKNIVYTGALTGYSGILLAVKAMNYIKNDNIKLDIYGQGELEELIRQYSQRNCNIRFHGKKSNEEIIKIQQEAWILINPRQVDHPISQVTFPSKVLEYMLSGRPVLTTRLNGFTEEYEDKVLWIEKEDAQYLSKLITSFLDSEERLDALGIKAKNFVVNTKNWETQINRICKFIDNN